MSINRKTESLKKTTGLTDIKSTSILRAESPAEGSKATGRVAKQQQEKITGTRRRNASVRDNVLEIKKTVIAFDENNLVELEQIITDEDEKAAFKFLRKSVYDRIRHYQQGNLKSHLDSTNSVQGFTKDKKENA
jgi:hypothetical protein